MQDNHSVGQPFEIPEVCDIIPRRLKPCLFIFFVIIIQFSGGIYLAAASDMVGTTALMQEDVLMAGYASLIGLAINFAVMFRIKFRFSTRTQLIVSGIILIIANVICVHTSNILLLTVTCFVAGWFRMQATFACNSTIQLWLTPVRDMSVFFCYVYIIVDGIIQLSGIATIYAAFKFEWQTMHFIMAGLLALMIFLAAILLKPKRAPLFIPLLGIDWIGAGLWSVFMLCFAYVCVYGNYYDWLDSIEIRTAIILGVVCLLLNLWRASFLRHPYISFLAMTNRNLIRATLVYLLFFTLLATEHVFEHSYACEILGFDETNLIDLNWYVFAGIVAGCIFTYFTFALRKWSYKNMTIIAFGFACVYLAYFYFLIDYGVDKEILFIPLFSRGFASVVISIVYLTSILQGGLPFMVFPQALTLNGFTGAVMSVTLGPAIIGEWLKHTIAKNAALLSSGITNLNTDAVNQPLHILSGYVRTQSLIVSMKEIYGYLLWIALISLLFIVIDFRRIKPAPHFPKGKTIKKRIHKLVLNTMYARPDDY